MSDFRGVGEVFRPEPIGCVVEILYRAPDPEKPGKWKLIPPFSKSVPGQERSFGIMQAVCTTERMRHPAREALPAFAAFNTCEPTRARMLRCRLLHISVKDCLKYHLGAFQAPPGFQNNPDKRTWCSGDAHKAKRWINNAWHDIPCPGRLCEYSQDGSGPKGQGTWCKPHTTLLAQFDWPEENKLLPRSCFEWSTMSWHNIGNLLGMFQRVDETAKLLGYDSEEFPVIGLQFTLHLGEKVKGASGGKPGRRFPEVKPTVEGDIMAWAAGVQKILGNADEMRRARLEAPKPLYELPPPGATVQQMQEATEAALNPQPRNVRGLKQVQGQDHDQAAAELAEEARVAALELEPGSNG